MHWRFYIFTLSATAAFCFMLLTAVTDYGPGGREPHNPLMSATTLNASLSRQPHRERGPAHPEPTGRPGLAGGFPQPALPALYLPTQKKLHPHPEQDVKAEGKLQRGKDIADRKLSWDPHGWFREEVALVTAYCPCSRCCGRQAAGITSIGKDAWSTGLAADPIYLDYGTRVFINGYGLSEVDDTGGAMRRHWREDGILHIDVRMTYHYQARQWGKQYLRVKIYDDR